MTKELSALLDGELEAHETSALWSELKSDRQLAGRWRDYQLIRDALRREENLAADIGAKVMSELELEPTVLAPRAGRRADRMPGTVMALAASVAGVAVVGWLALAPQQGPREVPAVARAVMPQGPVSLASSQAAQGAQEYREYLLAHQANAPGLHMQGGAQHIRTVSAIGSGQ